MNIIQFMFGTSMLVGGVLFTKHGWEMGHANMWIVEAMFWMGTGTVCGLAGIPITIGSFRRNATPAPAQVCVPDRQCNITGANYHEHYVEPEPEQKRDSIAEYWERQQLEEAYRGPAKPLHPVRHIEQPAPDIYVEPRYVPQLPPGNQPQLPPGETEEPILVEWWPVFRSKEND